MIFLIRRHHLGIAQMHVQDTNIHRSSQEAAALVTMPQVDRDISTTSECYRPSMDGLLDLNAPDMAPTYLVQQMQSTDSMYRAISYV